MLLVAGGVVLNAARHRRDPFTLACGLLCALLASTAAVRDAEWIVVLCLLAGAAVCVCGVTRGRTVLGFALAGLAWPLAGLRGLPWLGRTLARLGGLSQRAAVLRTLVWSALGLLVFGALFVSADALLAEWADAVLPDLTVDTIVLRVFLAVAVGGTVLAAAYLALNPPQAVGSLGRPAGPAPLRVARAGGRRRRRVRGAARGPGHGGLRRARLPAARRRASPTPSTCTRASASSPSPPR